MNSLQIIASILVYLFLFGWIGYHRGFVRELIVLSVALGGYLLLRQYSEMLVALLNYAYRFLVFSQAGGLSGDDPDAILAIQEVPNLIQPGQASAVVFLVWLSLLLLAYFASGRMVQSNGNRSDAGAALVGVLNGLLYFAIFLPELSAVLAPDATGAATDGGEERIGSVLQSTVGVIGESVTDFWISADGQQPLIAVGLLTLILVVVASTLRKSGVS